MSNIPNIVKETSLGLQRLTIPEALFQRREVQCMGEIDRETVCGLILQLRYLEQEDGEAPITMYINSPGGSVPDGLALYDVMRSISCPVRTVCVGTAASMGAVLFLCGQERYILPHSQVMIHDPLTGNVGGSALKVAQVSRELMKVREVMAEIIAQHTGKTPAEILERTATDTYFTAQEAVDFGLADKIIYEI